MKKFLARFDDCSLLFAILMTLMMPLWLWIMIDSGGRLLGAWP